MSTENSDQYRDQKLGLLIFEGFMSVFYIALSIILLFTPVMKNWQMPEGVKIGLGVLAGLYGIYRIGRVAKRLIQRNR